MNRHSSVSNDHAWKMSLLLFFIQNTEDQTEKWITGVIFVFSEGQECSEWRGQLAARAEAEDALSLGGPGESHDRSSSLSPITRYCRSAATPRPGWTGCCSLRPGPRLVTPGPGPSGVGRTRRQRPGASTLSEAVSRL